MTAFDAVALLLIALSAVAGFSRGAVRECVGLFALALSILATIAALPLAAPFARRLIHPSWLAAVLAALIVFALVFTGLQLLAGRLTASLDKRRLMGGANRAGGLLFGIVRGLVFLGLFALVFTRATPEALRPEWITKSLTFPVAQLSGRLLGRALPKGLTALGGLPALGAAVGAAAADPPDADAPAAAAPGAEGDAPQPRRSRMKGVKRDDHGYTRRARDRLDALVEQSN